MSIVALHARGNRAAMHRTSRYLTMPDGVRLAIDVYLPARRTGPVATILHQTRYFRSVAMRRGFRWLPLARCCFCLSLTLPCRRLTRAATLNRCLIRTC